MTIHINSARGIGRTTVRKAAGDWHGVVKLHLHLRGLEGLQIKGTAATYSSGYSSSAGGSPNKTERRPHAEGAKQEILPADDPHNLQVRPVAKEGEAKIPLDGYFEVVIPAKFLEENPGGFELHWIDFYR